MPIVLMEGFNKNQTSQALIGPTGGGRVFVSGSAVGAGTSAVNGRGYSVANYPGARAFSGSANVTLLRTRNYGNFAEWTVGLGVNPTNMLDGMQLIEFENTAIDQLSLELAEVTAGTYQIEIKRGVTLLATSPLTYAYGTYVHLEIQAVASTTATGSVEVKLNNQTIININTVITSGANNDFRRARFNIQTQAGGSCLVDDIIVQAGAGGDAFLGDSYVFHLGPTADGNQSDFTPLGAGTNFSEVDDPTEQDDDASYVFSTANGDKDLYAYEDLPTVAFGTIHGVQTEIDARLLTSGARNITPLVRTAAVDGSGVIQGVNSVSWALIRQILLTNPANLAAWIKADINASEFGLETVA